MFLTCELIKIKKRLYYKQIMFGFEHNDIDPNDTVPIHAIKVLLRKNLPALGPVIRQRVVEGFEAHLRSHVMPTGGESVICS